MHSDSPSAEVLALLEVLSADPRPHELDGFDGPLAHYRAVFPAPRRRIRKAWKPAVLSSVLGAKLVAAGAAMAVGVGGTALAAYHQALPAWAQNIAHTTIGAPAAAPEPTPSTTPRGPDATGPAAYGLCTAWTRHQVNAAQPFNATSLKNLATAAGGESNIAAYCATVPHPGSSKPSGDAPGRPTDKGTDKGTGKPTTPPTNKPTNKGTGKPTTPPTNKPTNKGTGKPTTPPTNKPTDKGTGKPTTPSTNKPTDKGTGKPSTPSTNQPTGKATGKPSAKPTAKPAA
jgi:hypothetical protein